MAFYFMKPLFVIGKICATPGAASLNIDLGVYLRRHNCGDWGNGLREADYAANENSLDRGGRLFSCYLLDEGTKLCIMTDASRTTTTVMLAEEH